jgi:Protein of unknown function (DUF1214)
LRDSERSCKCQNGPPIKWVPFVVVDKLAGDANAPRQLLLEARIAPGADKEVNWLPAPKGPFNLTMRLYAPKSNALTGKRNPPVIRAASLPSLGGQ